MSLALWPREQGRQAGDTAALCVGREEERRRKEGKRAERRERGRDGGREEADGREFPLSRSQE